jgi:hypothetical protein
MLIDSKEICLLEPLVFALLGMKLDWIGLEFGVKEEAVWMTLGDFSLWNSYGTNIFKELYMSRILSAVPFYSTALRHPTVLRCDCTFAHQLASARHGGGLKYILLV